MGASGTFEDALAGVTAFDKASRKESKDAKKAKKKKHKSEKEHRKSDHHKDKKDKKGKKSRRKASSSDSDASDAEGDPMLKLSVTDQVEAGKAAARVVRELKVDRPDVVQDLREIFRRLDDLQAVNIESLPEDLKDKMTNLFTSLHLLKSKAGYHRPKGRTPIVSLLGPVLDEKIAEPAVKVAPQAKPEFEAPSAASTPVTEAAEIGPSMPASMQDEGAEAAGEGQEADEREQLESKPKAKMQGPAMPPPEILAAAAAHAQAYLEAERARAEAPMPGPAAPDALDDEDNASDDVRVKEVLRILRLKDEYEHRGEPLDSYKVLYGEGPRVADVQRTYLKVSQLLHPDKNKHERAGDAFDIARKAAQELKDPALRAALDARLAAAAERAEFQAEQDAEKEARKWRIARGQATAEDLAWRAPVGPQQREEWMTTRPEARAPKAGPPEKSVKAFSQQGGPMRMPGEGAEWFLKPGDKLEQNLLKASEDYRQVLMAAGPEAAGPEAAMLDAMKKFSSPQRPKSLLEAHQEKLGKGKKRKAEAKAESSNPVIQNAMTGMGLSDKFAAPRFK